MPINMMLRTKTTALVITLLATGCLLVGCATLTKAFCPNIGLLGVDCEDVEAPE